MCLLLAVGIGALCGSTILLLTLPWFLSVFGGRVDIHHVTGKPNYCRPKLANPKEVINCAYAMFSIIDICYVDIW